MVHSCPVKLSQTILTGVGPLTRSSDMYQPNPKREDAFSASNQAPKEFGPIVLTEFDEAMSCFGGYKEASFFKEIPAGSDTIGQHNFCAGLIRIRPISRTHRVIFCKRCNLRIVIPREVDTYAKLRQWCAEKIAEQRKRQGVITQLAGTYVVKQPAPESAEIVRAADEERRRIRKIIGD